MLAFISMRPTKTRMPSISLGAVCHLSLKTNLNCRLNLCMRLFVVFPKVLSFFRVYSTYLAVMGRKFYSKYSISILDPFSSISRRLFQRSSKASCVNAYRHLLNAVKTCCLIGGLVHSSYFRFYCNRNVKRTKENPENRWFELHLRLHSISAARVSFRLILEHCNYWLVRSDLL